MELGILWACPNINRTFPIFSRRFDFCSTFIALRKIQELDVTFDGGRTKKWIEKCAKIMSIVETNLVLRSGSRKKTSHEHTTSAVFPKKRGGMVDL